MRIMILALLACSWFATQAFAQQLQLVPAGGTPTVVLPSASTADSSKEEDKKDDKEKRKSGEVVVSTVIEGLNNPFSVAVEDGTDRIFVAESGAERIIEVKDGKAIEVASDFPASSFRGYKAGPLSLFSAGQNVLLVGHDSAEGVGSITKLTLNTDSKPAAAPEAKDATKPEKSERQTVVIENQGGAKLGQFSNLILKHTMVYAVTHGDKENGWVAIAEIQDGKLTTLRPSIPTAKRTSYPGPTCCTVSPGGEYLVGAQMGQDNEAKDSRLAFYTLQGEILNNFEVELNDIVSLAYSPSRKHLFAIDYNFADPTKGGLYKLIGKGVDKCDIKKLQDLSYATSMTFDSKGTLWITSLGGPTATDGKPNGKLIKIEGLDDIPEESDETDAEETGE